MRTGSVLTCGICGNEFYATAYQLSNPYHAPKRFCSKACGYKGRIRMPTKTEAERFWPKVQKDLSGCWLWTGPLDAGGYGRFALIRFPGEPRRQVRPHRWAFEQAKGPVPSGLDLDHLCRVRHCVNPDHLEAVTRQVNAQRGIAGALLRERSRMVTHCPKGHPYDETNTAIYNGKRRCRSCSRENARAYYWKVQDRAQTRRSS